MQVLIFLLFSQVAMAEKLETKQAGHDAPYFESNEEIVTPQEISKKRALAAAEFSPESSAGKRRHKVLSLGLVTGGSPWPSAGAQLGIFLTPQLNLELDANFGTFYSLPNKSKTWTTELYSLRGKFYWGNSFYTNIGIASRIIKENDIYAGQGEENEASYFTLQATGGALVEIGNRWQWNIFFVGCDFIGVYIPFAVFWRDFSPSALTPDEAGFLKRKFKRKAPDFALQYLKLNFGFSF